MNPERLVAIGAGIITIGLLANLPSAFLDYRLGSQAENWNVKTGYVEGRKDITSYRFHFFIRSAKYSHIEYRFEDREGNWIRGAALAPMLSEVYKDGSIEIRVNPQNYEQSLPALSISGYKTANAWSILFSLFASYGMYLVTRRLWREGSKPLLVNLNIQPIKSRDFRE